MNQVLLKILHIKNFGPIVDDEVIFYPFTYFIGRNNSGKSHYLRAIEVLLASRNPAQDEIIKFQNNKTKEILIEGYFEGVKDFTQLLKDSHHKQVVDSAIDKNGVLKIVRMLDPSNEAKTQFGIFQRGGNIYNPSGFTGNLLKILPEPISIVATADTIDELKSKENTALSKLKKEVMVAFFDELRIKTKEALRGLDEFLHGKDVEQRSQELGAFEQRLKEELMGEFADVVPSVEFALPDEEVIAKEMRIFLDDGYRSEVEQKGHGLQRATLLALLRLLAKYGARYRDRPSPIFLIGELESFLHPYAQKQLAEILNTLVKQYQIVTTTHSPFIITPQTIDGYRRVRKQSDQGTKAIMPKEQEVDLKLIKRHLERRGNLEGLFADRIILIEGDNDEGFYDKLREIFQIPLPQKKFTLFVKTDGKEILRQARRFYLQMGFDDVTIICDLDYLFSNDAKFLLSELKVDDTAPSRFRQHIGWTQAGDPSLGDIVQMIQSKGEPGNLEKIISDLRKQRIFVLRRGSPEMYYKNPSGRRDGWMNLNTEADLLDAEYLKTLMEEVLK